MCAPDPLKVALFSKHSKTKRPDHDRNRHLYTRAEASDLHVLNFKATRLWFAALALVFVNYGLLTNVLGWTFYWQPAGDSAATTVVTALSIS